MLNKEENQVEINKYKMASMLHVFTARIEKCQSAHDVTIIAQNIEADIDDLFSDVEVNQTHLDQQLKILHIAVSMIINWDTPQHLRTEQIQSLKEKIKKGLI